MPCDSIQQSTIEFLAKSTDVGLLRQALEALGYTVTPTATGFRFYHRGTGMSGTYDSATAKLHGQGRTELDIDEVKRAYSKQLVLATAKQEGWQVSWTFNADGHQVANVEKAAY